MHSSSQIKLLIIEDNEEEKEMLESFFTKQKGISSCLTASDGAEGIKIAKKSSPDVVLTDLLMPNLDGLEVVQKVKALFDGKIKIIVLSGVSSAKIANEALSSGVDYYLIKPIDLDYLAKKIVAISTYSNDLHFPQTEGNRDYKFFVASFIKKLGVPINNCAGYKYICEVISFMLNTQKITSLKQIYYNIAEKNSTSIECIDADIRNAIKRAHKFLTPEYKNLFDVPKKFSKPPSNSNFLGAVKEYVLSTATTK